MGEVIGCDPWATWLLGISALVFLLCTICLTLAFCNDGGYYEGLLSELEDTKLKHKYEHARSENLEKLLFETFELIGIQTHYDEWLDDDDLRPSSVEGAANSGETSTRLPTRRVRKGPKD